jgi:hypothetical protein
VTQIENVSFPFEGPDESNFALFNMHDFNLLQVLRSFQIQESNSPLCHGILILICSISMIPARLAQAIQVLPSLLMPSHDASRPW